MTFRPIFAALVLILGFAAAAPGAAAEPYADWREHGPRALVMTYRVAPGDRPAFKTAVRASTLPRLERLKAAGELSGYHVLANRYVDSAGWDLMVILDFKDTAALTRWRAVEDEAPAGLAPPALKLLTSAESAPSDRMFAAAAPAQPGDPSPVYLVVPYDYLVSTDEYLAYVKGYLVPQTEGWMADGALQSYSVYLPRYPAGRVWSAQLVLAYRGDAGLARRDAVVRSVRAKLMVTSPEWKTFADNKQKIRTEKQPVIADEITLARR